MNAPNQLSFLPENYLVRKAQHRTNLVCAALFVVMIGVIAIAFTTAERQLRDAERRYAAIDKQETDAARRIAEMKQMHERQRVLARQADLAASLIDRVPRSYLLADITNRLPSNVSLTDLDMIRKKRAASSNAAQTAFERKKAAKGNKAEAQLPPAPDQYDVTLKLSGIAGSDAQVARFVNNLSGSELFSEVNLLLSAQLERTEGELRKFNIEVTLNPGADIRPAANARPASFTQVQQ